MRLSPERIKEAILHPEEEVRRMAVRYFAEAFSPDPTVMPVVIQAIDKYGRVNREYSGNLLDAKLAQTEATLEWLIAELHRDEVAELPHYAGNVSEVLACADVTLLRPRAERLLASPHFSLNWKDALTQRLEMADWDMERGWQELERYAEDSKNAEYISDVDTTRADRIIEALGRFGTAVQDRTIHYLSQHVEDYTNHPLGWLEPWAARLAGEAHLSAAIPLLIEKLREDADYLNGQCQYGLRRMGTDEVVEAIAAAYPNEEWHVRLYLAGTLEVIHTDRCVTVLQELLAHETDTDLKYHLTGDLIQQITPEAIEPTRRLLAEEPPEVPMFDLQEDLVNMCLILGERFPEFEQWHQEVQEKQRQRQKRLEELAASGDLFWTAAPPSESKPAREEAAAPERWAPPVKQPFERLETKVGRNDPCPCGSGKKFKKCCLKN